MTLTNRPFAIAVVGNGVDAALAAAMLARSLPRQRYRITVVRSAGNSEPFGPVVPSSPGVRSCHADLGLEEVLCIREMGATYSLGVAYSGWSQRRPAYFRPFGDIGAPLHGVGFHHIVARLRAAGAEVRLGDFALATLLAQASRFAHPSDDPRSVRSTYSYALHLPAGSYAAELRRIAAAAGAEFKEARLEDFELDPEGAVALLRLDGGAVLQADLYIDASGPSSEIASRLPGQAFESWRQWLPVNRAVALHSATDIPPAPYSHVEALSGGWRQTVPAAGIIGRTVGYSSDTTSDESALDLLRDGIVGQPSGDITLASFEQGRYARPWISNCVAIGAAAAVLEPTHPAAHALLQSAIERLLLLIPSVMSAEIEAREYSRLMSQELDRTRDFTILPYAIGDRGLPLKSLPDALAMKLEAWRSRGRIPLSDGDTLDEIDWALVLDEHGVRPRRYDLLADAVPLPQLQQQLAGMRSMLIAAAAEAPSHGEYLVAMRRPAAA